jgi:tetratricopeptide (TPR) repeat protein
MDGRGELALDTSRRVAKKNADAKYAYGEYARSLPLLTLLRLQRWQDALAEPAPAMAGRLESAIHSYARAVALAHTGKLAQARDAAVVLQTTATNLQRDKSPSEDDKFARTILDVLLTWQQAELALAAGDGDAALLAAQKGVTLEDSIEDREPPLLAAGARNLLGHVMLESKNWSVAERAFRDDLADQPGSGWALRGLTRSLARQGKSTEAASVQTQLEKTWVNADVALRKL